MILCLNRNVVGFISSSVPRCMSTKTLPHVPQLFFHRCVPEQERRRLVFKPGSEEAPPDVISPVRNCVPFADLHLQLMKTTSVLTLVEIRQGGGQQVQHTVAFSSGAKPLCHRSPPVADEERHRCYARGVDGTLHENGYFSSSAHSLFYLTQVLLRNSFHLHACNLLLYPDEVLSPSARSSMPVRA